jgi:CRISPR-associated exonuclease Cas4
VAAVTFGVGLAPLVLLAGFALVGAAAWGLWKLVGSRRSGELVYSDEGRGTSRTLVSDEYGLIGRPDEVWRLRNGAVVPVELKSRRAPASGVLPSHRVQVEAYCLLLESANGRPPPYGVVVYAGGVRRTVAWDLAARREVLGVLEEIRRPYDGRASPSVGKCRGCRWRTGCDARAL